MVSNTYDLNPPWLSMSPKTQFHFKEQPMHQGKWPPSFDEFMSGVADAWGVVDVVKVLGRLDNGRSGAYVAVVDFRGKNFDGQGILKLSEDDKPNEKDRHGLAVQFNTKFAERHIPTLVSSFFSNGKSALLMPVVEGGLNFTKTFTRLPHNQRLVAGQTVSEGLLFEWNENYRIGGTPVGAAELMTEWLGRRLDPSSGSARLQDLLRNELGIDPDCVAFHLNGKVLPNPLCFALNPKRLGDVATLMPAIGAIHGDLHGDNILVGERRAGSVTYYLIDLADFRSDGFLFYDNAYLEMSICIDERASVPVLRWMDLCFGLARLTDRKDVQKWPWADDHGLGWLIAIIRSGITRWTNKKEGARRQDMVNQAMLARVAAALNFANKRTDEEKRKKAFVLAAHQLEVYLTFNRVDWPKTNPPTIQSSGDYPRPSSSNWREVWDLCDGFDGRRNSFILMAGPDFQNADAAELAVLGRIPWSLVLDFDPNSRTNGLAAAVEPVLANSRGFHVVCPGDSVDVNYREGVCWLMAQGMIGRPETIPKDEREWRRMVPTTIGRLADELLKALSPRPLVVVVIAPGLKESVAKRTWDEIDARFRESASTVIVHDPLREPPVLDESQGNEGDTLIRSVATSMADLLRGLREMLGVAAMTLAAQIPVMGVNGQAGSAKSIPSDQVARFRETLEIVHGGLVVEDAAALVEEAPGFLRGATITWRELDMHEDVDRAVTGKLAKRVEELLERRRTVSARLVHSPGAGGTTVARRIAWDMKDRYPTVLLKRWTDNSAGRIEEIFNLSELPVLVVIEAADVPRPLRDALFNDLKSRNVSFVFLDVERSARRAIGASGQGTGRSDQVVREESKPFSLLDPMPDEDAGRFLRRYREQAPPTRHNALDELLKPANLDFRSAFFFGLFAFERDFVHVPMFVQAHLSDCIASALPIIEKVALVTRYSQQPLSADTFRVMMDLGENNALRLGRDLGSGARSLINYDGITIRMVHPLIAEAVLRQRLSAGQPNDPESWKARLGEFCRQFIDDMARPELSASEELRTLLYQLFVRREPWEAGLHDGGSGVSRRHFSDLLLEILTPEGRHLVLERLCEKFPRDAHFWNHLGRHHNLALRSDYREAERCILKAIELEDWNDIHYHALGMIYRFELRRRLLQRLERNETLIERWALVESLFGSASDRFAEARRRATESQYPLVTTLQMITETIEALFRLSTAKDYNTLIGGSGPVSTWCRSQLRAAEEIIDDLRHLRGREDLPAPAAKCEGSIQGFYGNVEGMVTMLGGLLQREDVARPPVRRLIAHAYRRRAGNQMATLKPKHLKRIRDMMEDNLVEDPANTGDLRMWFHSARRLDDFSLIGAMDRLSTWAQTDRGSIDAYYYLYILHFIRYRQGLAADHREVFRYVDLCKGLALGTLRTRSFEWLGKEPLWCPLVHQSELGWDEDKRFVSRTDLLERVDGIIQEIKSPQAGSISVSGIPAFFVPGKEFRAGQDENEKVTFYLGFSYEGLRAWQVERE